jgi:Domain of unknown function (DU1801)
MGSKATTVAEYIAELPPDRANEIQAVRAVVLQHLPEGYVETINWGMISYEVPLAIEPKTYNGKPLMYAALASQKTGMALHLCHLYFVADVAAQFEANWRGGKKLNMGKACLRFKSIADIDLPLIGKTIASVSVEQFIKAAKR